METNKEMINALAEAHNLLTVCTLPASTPRNSRQYLAVIERFTSVVNGLVEGTYVIVETPAEGESNEAE